jgi:hypothetical protein
MLHEPIYELFPDMLRARSQAAGPDEAFRDRSMIRRTSPLRSLSLRGPALHPTTHVEPWLLHRSHRTASV